MRRKKPNLQSGVDEPVQPDSKEQSGSAGRNTGAAVLDQQKDSGQGRYGQSGYTGGSAERETKGQEDYRKSGDGSDDQGKSESNRGSGRADHEADEYQRDHATKGARNR